MTLCETCGDQAVAVIAVPSVPYSAAYCQKCLEANAHPWQILVANTAAMGGLKQAAPFWLEMVKCTCKRLGRSLDEFKADVLEVMSDDARHSIYTQAQRAALAAHTTIQGGFADLTREKAARLYYQDIVYTVCNWLDYALNAKTTCGTLEAPTTGVQDSLKEVGQLVIDLRDRIEAVEKVIREVFHIDNSMTADGCDTIGHSLTLSDESRQTIKAILAREKP